MKGVITKVFWTELSLLLLVITGFLFTLKFQYLIMSNKALQVDLYYYLSLAIIATAQVVYFFLLWRTRTINYGVLIIGLVVTWSTVAWWFYIPKKSQVIDFSELYLGEVVGPILYAVFICFIQVVLTIVSSSVKRLGKEG